MKRELTHGPLFSGVEGFGSGAGIKTEWSCESEKYQTDVIKKNSGDGHTVYGDIRTPENPPSVNIISECRERIYIIACPVCKFGEGGSPKSVFRQPCLPGELPRVYPGWRERRDLPEPRTSGSTDELPDPVDRNRCAGNAVQPLTAQYLFECIKCSDR